MAVEQMTSGSREKVTEANHSPECEVTMLVPNHWLSLERISLCHCLCEVLLGFYVPNVIVAVKYDDDPEVDSSNDTCEDSQLGIVVEVYSDRHVAIVLLLLVVLKVGTRHAP